MSVTPQPDPLPRTDPGAQNGPPSPTEEPLEGVLTADEVRDLEANGLSLSDVIREIEDTTG